MSTNLPDLVTIEHRLRNGRDSLDHQIDDEFLVRSNEAHVNGANLLSQEAREYLVLATGSDGNRRNVQLIKTLAILLNTYNQVIRNRSTRNPRVAMALDVMARVRDSGTRLKGIWNWLHMNSERQVPAEGRSMSSERLGKIVHMNHAIQLELDELRGITPREAIRLKPVFANIMLAWNAQKSRPEWEQYMVTRAHSMFDITRKVCDLWLYRGINLQGALKLINQHNQNATGDKIGYFYTLNVQKERNADEQPLYYDMTR